MLGFLGVGGFLSCVGLMMRFLVGVCNYYAKDAKVREVTQRTGEVREMVLFWSGKVYNADVFLIFYGKKFN